MAEIAALKAEYEKNRPPDPPKWVPNPYAPSDWPKWTPGSIQPKGVDWWYVPTTTCGFISMEAPTGGMVFTANSLTANATT